MNDMPRATEADALDYNESKLLCELIDGRIIVKLSGTRVSYLAVQLSYHLSRHLDTREVGFVCGPDLLFRLAPGLLLSPNLTLTYWDRCPGGKVPDERIATIMPALAVEIYCLSDHPAEMERKIAMYFEAGVELVWLIDPIARSCVVYESATRFALSDALTGGSVLPGFSLPLATLFEEFD